MMKTTIPFFFGIMNICVPYCTGVSTIIFTKNCSSLQKVSLFILRNVDFYNGTVYNQYLAQGIRVQYNILLDFHQTSPQNI